MFSPAPALSCLTLRVTRGDLFLERRVKPERRWSTEAAQTTTWASTSHFAANTVASCTNGRTLDWTHCTLARQPTPPSPLLVSSFGFERAIPIVATGPDLPPRDPWRGGVRGRVRSRVIQLRKERTRV